MKVLLIDPPFYRLIGFYNRYFPLSLVNVGTVLKEAGYEVVVYDADTNENPCAMDYTRLPDHYRRYLASFQETDHPVWQEVRRTIQQSRPDVIGISIWTTYAAAAFHVARIGKEIDPACPVLMGGPHATVKAEEVLSICPDVDYVIRGEGESTAVELVAALAASARGTPVSLETIGGVSFRADGVIKHNPARERIKNLDELPVPDRSLLKNKSTYSSEDMGLVMTSRGCPFSCSFCATEARQADRNIVAPRP